MIVVVIVAILAAIALPSYQEFVRRGYRSEGRQALQQAALWMERAATANGVYPLTAAFPASLKTLSSGAYQIALESPTSNVNADAGRTWILTATRAGRQAGDRCGDFTLTHTGTRGLVNNASGSTVQDCWDR